ncbi:MAG: aminotransferase class I/II-fold pyridoxal phosphate-dependent enzyme [Limnothrix sp. RL_2_0]|nr:aminotransferase class I/II-fold pyridoxal phosphate-dependent enzyme [Limnothrix sp. RL_2_0]
MNEKNAKSNVNSLAIFNGHPKFKEKLHVGRPNIGDRVRLLNRINDILDRRWLTNNGIYLEEFEQRLCEQLGVKHCIVMCNGTVALEIAIRAADLKGEVILPSFTFIATAHALQWQEITPVFCDIDPQSHTINPWQIESLITPRTTGILAVHLWGNACDIESISKIARKHHLKLLFDAAHAFGCSYKGQMIGNFGDAEVFSFHATKFFNSFEGGAVATNNDELASKIRLMRNFGFSGYDQVDYIGTNGKMSEISAAMGLTGLESLESFIQLNRKNYNQYADELSDIKGLRLFSYKTSEKCNYQYVILEIDEELSGLSRDTLMSILWAENVLARRYFYPGSHRMEPYRSYFPHAGLLLGETEKLSQRILVLPTGASVTSPEISEICQVIRISLSNSREINQRLREKESKVSLVGS